jgi:hypothetical protein
MPYTALPARGRNGVPAGHCHAATFKQIHRVQIAETMPKWPRQINLAQSQEDYGIYKVLTFGARTSTFSVIRAGDAARNLRRGPELSRNAWHRVYPRLATNRRQAPQAAACAQTLAAHSGPEQGPPRVKQPLSLNAICPNLSAAFKRCFNTVASRRHGCVQSSHGVPCCQTGRAQRPFAAIMGFEGHVVSDFGAITDIKRRPLALPKR